jgi:hypothetical protein
MMQLNFLLIRQYMFFNAFIIQEFDNKIHSISIYDVYYAQCSRCKSYYEKILNLSSSNSSRIKNDYCRKSHSFSKTK